MSQKTFNIVSKTNSELEIELAFCIATARAENAEIVKLVIPSDTERFVQNSKKILRALKRDGRVQLFEDVEKLTSDTTEARYLRNKYPDIVSSCEGDSLAIIVKL